MVSLTIDDSTIYRLLEKKDLSFFTIPPFQRAYTWKREEWENLYADISENEVGYFIGSMIMLADPNNVKKGGVEKHFSIIDGQQRLTTISILLAAVYSSFSDYNINLDLSIDKNKYEDIRYMLTLDLGKGNRSRLVLQNINDNNATYLKMLFDAGMDLPPISLPRATNKQIYRAYKYFKKSIAEDLEKVEDKKTFLFEILDKIGYATIADITVVDISDAIQIFSTLNNRGIPLSAADLIKISSMQALGVRPDDELKGWNYIIQNVSEGKESISDRFFRSFINSIGPSLEDEYDYEFVIATSSNILKQYEKIIQLSPKNIFSELIESSYDYKVITGSESSGNESLDLLLKNLSRQDSTTSHILLLYLFRKFRQDTINANELIEVVDFLIKFYARRNLIDKPQARGIPKLYTQLIEESLYLDGNDTVKYLIRVLSEKSASLFEFKEYLKGPIYEDNQELARYLLASISEYHTNNEYKSAWETDKTGKPIWTIEHILPQNKKLLPEWIEMIGDGDATEASKIQSDYVHTLGNLTLSGNNSSLSDAPFINKRDAMKNDVMIGYKNGLWLNKDLAKLDKWNKEEIIKRQKWLVNEILQKFCFSSEKQELSTILELH